ncbi:phenylalanine--tRNA ligase subunit alpha [Patescibacteria group bacterium]|nr:phenylalanine--tRNA ligase subunit alpha [Patescibacteria group bacterium]
MATGHIHPLSRVISEATHIFSEMGFTVEEGPYIETIANNFDTLNFPKDHPARDMQDSFFMEGELENMLRTHTTDVHARYIEQALKNQNDPPYRLVALGKVFRNEATDVTHEAEFFQVDGFVLEKGITLAHLKGTLQHFYSRLMGGNAEIRFRPSFFPFTEPSVEIDMRVMGDSVPEKLRGKWIEVMGAGMTHPNVIRNYGLDPSVWRGFAFGGGLDRVALLRWGIDDIRHMHSGDLRFINQF